MVAHKNLEIYYLVLALPQTPQLGNICLLWVSGKLGGGGCAWVETHPSIAGLANHWDFRIS